ncbi:DUF1521 domain-containing protein [Bradyrhizobium sp. Ec3.3]|uniref:DUF1521 domain-containing protein n=1 Tax=Bradyrhizobium sp. Ec3.3 TaxID=189753 RepID=UPI0003F7D5CE|nr:DUF1521 domain-containing protein [Bradyrhizobium sp. Ec3.3]
MVYLPVTGLPVVGAFDAATSNLVPEGAAANTTFNTLLERYAGGVPAGTYQYQSQPPLPDPVWTHEVKDGKATINLGDKYTITAKEKDGTWMVRNNETGHVTKIHGDPHVDANGDGRDDFDFKKDMTLQLDDGTKITVNTVDYGNGKTISSKLTITNGDNAMVIEGLGDDKDGKDNLKVTQSNAGRTLDQLTPDGSQTIHEENQGWVDGCGRKVNQAIIHHNENPDPPPDLKTLMLDMRIESMIGRHGRLA